MKLSFFKNLFLIALITSMTVILKSLPATAYDKILDNNTINYAPAITNSSGNTVIYVGTNNDSNNYMYYYYDNGTQKDNISMELYQLSAPPVVDNDGTVYYGLHYDDVHEHNIYAYYDNGTRKWDHPPYTIVLGYPALSLDNKTLYYVDYNNSYMLEAAYTDNGSVKYSYNIIGNDFNSIMMVVGPDGTVYIQAGNHIYAIEDNGTGFKQKWKVQTSYPALNSSDPSILSSLSIGPDGTIYAPASSDEDGYSTLYAIRPDGSVKWALKLQGELKSATAVVDRYGNIYVAATGAFLYKISDDGKILDKVGISLDNNNKVFSPVLVDEGRYVCQRHAYDNITCYDTDNLSSSLPEYSTYTSSMNTSIESSPQVFDGKMYVATSGGLYVFDNSTLFNLDTSAPWPSFRHDSQNTGHLILHNMAFPKDPTNNNSEVYVTSIAPDFPENRIISSTIYTPEEAEKEKKITTTSEPNNIESISKVITTDIFLHEPTTNNYNSRVPASDSTRIQIVGLTLPTRPLFYKYVNGKWINLQDNTACDNCNFSYKEEKNDNGTYSGKYTISFTITDGGSLDSDGTANGKISDPLVIAQAKPPLSITSLQATPNPVMAGENVIFTAQTEGSIVDYLWDFNSDGVIDRTTTTPTVTYRYTRAKTYNVTLTVIDSDNNTAKKSIKLKVNGVGPEITSFTASPYTGYAPLSVTFNAESSDPTDALTGYIYTFSDNDKRYISFTGSMTRTYTEPGNYDATVVVEDEGGYKSTPSTIHILVLKKSDYSDQGVIDNDYSWAKQAIDYLYTMNISEGFPDGTFKPDAYVTRAQMAALLSRALSLNTQQCPSQPFTDVSTDVWYCKYVEAIKNDNITQGNPDGTFNPDAYVTRAQMAEFIVKALSLDTQKCSKKPFPDVSTDNPYCPYIEAIKDADITRGYPDGTYRPDSYVTRAEMAVYLERMGLYK